MRHSPHLISTVALLLAGGHALMAQSLQTGALMGVIRDANGKPMAGVQVRATSGQIQRTAVTDAKGEYRFSLMNSGAWTLTVAQSGYQTSTTTAHLSINATNTANFKLRPLAEATVAVTAVASDMDVTTAQIATNVGAETLSKLPMDMTNRGGLDGLMATLPGVQSYGVAGGAYFINGATFDQNLFTVDGTITNLTNNNTISTGAARPPREFMENVEVVTGAFGAEYNVLGGVINVLTKSGSNTWASDLFYGTNFPNSMAQPKYQANSKPADSKPLPKDQYHRYGATVSGPIVKDKLFFFFGYQGFKDKLPSNTNGAPNWNGLVSGSPQVDGPNLFSLKMNWFISTDHQLVFSASHSRTVDATGLTYPPSIYWSAGTLEYGSKSASNSQNVNLTWNWLVNSELYVITSLGKYSTPFQRTPNTSASDYASVYDYRYWLTGPGRNASNKPESAEYWSYQSGTDVGPYRSDNPNRQFRIDLTWSRGNHQVKAGYLQQDTKVEKSTTANSIYMFYNDVIGPWYNYMGDPNGLEKFENGATNTSFKGYLQGYYLKDLWEVLPGVRVDVGARFDPFRFVGAAGVFNGVELAKFANVGRQLQPRLGVTWDINNDGKNKVYAHWGRFFQTMPMASVAWANASSFTHSGWYENHWIYNVDYATGQAPFTIRTDPATGQLYAPDFFMSSGTVGHPAPRATDIRIPHKDTLTLGGEWTLPNGWSAGGSWQYWTAKDVLEDSYFMNDDGTLAFPDILNPNGTRGMNEKVRWNPHPGPVTFIDPNGQVQTWNSPFPDPVDRYITLNLHARHQGKNHYLAVDYTWVHHYGNYRGAGTSFPMQSTGSSVPGEGGANTSQEFDFHKTIASGNFEGDPVHQIKVLGMYDLPLWGQKLTFGPVLTWQSGLGVSSGIPTATQPQFQNYAGLLSAMMQPGNQRGDMGHAPSNLNLDLSLNMAIKVRKVVITPACSILNVFNASPVMGYFTRKVMGYSSAYASPDPNYGMPRYWKEGRSITAGFSMKF